jgi:hypothetical protein
MVFADSGKISSPLWYINEKFMSEDIAQMTLFEYVNMCNILSVASLGCYGAIRPKDAELPAICMGGLGIEHYTSMTLVVHTGSVVSFTGSYVYNELWQWHAGAGESFFASVAKAESLTISDGDASDRIDIIEIRPVMTPFKVDARDYYGGSTVYDNVLTEFGVEIQVVEGTPGTGAAPSSTAGWIKIAEVYVPASATSITSDEVLGIGDSDLWTTDTRRVRNFTNILQKDSAQILNKKNIRGKLNSLMINQTDDDCTVNTSIFYLSGTGVQNGPIEVVERGEGDDGYANQHYAQAILNDSVLPSTAYKEVAFYSFWFYPNSNRYQWATATLIVTYTGSTRIPNTRYTYFLSNRDNLTSAVDRLRGSTSGDRTIVVVHTFTNAGGLFDILYDDVHDRLVTVGGYSSTKHAIVSAVCYDTVNLTGFTSQEQAYPNIPYDQFTILKGVTLCRVDNKLWACASCDTSPTRALIFSSPDGLNWTFESEIYHTTINIEPHKILWSIQFEKFFLTVSDDSSKTLKIYTSPDGVAWTLSYQGISDTNDYTPNRMKEITELGGVFILAPSADYGMAFIFTLDGVEWHRVDDIIKVPNDTVSASTVSLISNDYPQYNDFAYIPLRHGFFIGGQMEGSTRTFAVAMGG